MRTKWMDQPRTPNPATSYKYYKKSFTRDPELKPASGFKDFVNNLPGLYGESFTAREIAAVQLAVSEANGCLLDISRCSHLAREVGFSELDILEIRNFTSNHPRIRSLIGLAIQILHGKGFVSSNQLKEFYSAGYSEEARFDLMGIVTMCTLSNYVANAAAA